MTLAPQPPWPQVHIEYHEAPGWLDDHFRSTLWTEILAAVANTFANGNDITGDYGTMEVTEGAVPAGCGYDKDVSALALDTDVYRQLRVRLRGRGTTPQYQIGVEYTDASTELSGFVDAPVAMTPITLQLDAAKVVHAVRLYAKSNTANGTAQIDFDYAVLQSQFPIVPYELFEADLDLQHTLASSAFRLRYHHDVLQGVTALRYRFDEDMGVVATDLGPSKLNGTLVNTPTWAAGKYNRCLQFNGAASERVDTGYTTTLAATGALTMGCWIKASAGATGVVMGFGKAPGGVPNRIQIDLQAGDHVRIYAKDDAANVREYTSTAVVSDDSYHRVVAVVDAANDKVQLFVDGLLDGETAGALGVITLDLFDLTIGCLHSEGGYTDYYTGDVDEPFVYTKALATVEVIDDYVREPASGISRVAPGAWMFAYVADQSESLVYKLMRGRVIDKASGGDADQPWVEHTGEDDAEIIQERTWSRTFGTATQISAVAAYVIDDSVDELYKNIDTTNRTIINKFKNEGCWNVLQKLAESATFATGEVGAAFWTDAGGCFRFKKYGAYGCAHHVSDGSDGENENIIDIQVKETIKGSPKLANDVKVIIFEEEYVPTDQDSWTEAIDGWSSPDPTDVGYPQSDAVDKTTGQASVKFATTNPGTMYRMRLDFSEVDIAGFDELRFDMKYGVGLTIDTFRLQMLKLGAWGTTSDYWQEINIAPQGAAAWYEYVIDLTAIGLVGYPGNRVSSLEIRAEQAVEVGSGGFLIDNLRFIRTEKSGSFSDATSQTNYGKRTLTLVDKNISSTTWAANVASNVVANRKYPIMIARAVVRGKGQPGYRPPQTVTVTSRKDGLNQVDMQLVRARHRVDHTNGYVVDLDLIAARTSIAPPAYSALVGPALNDVQTILSEWRKRLGTGATNPLRTQYS